MCSLVNHSSAEAAFERHLVDDHSVLHVVAGVRDDGHDRVGSHRIVVDACTLFVNDIQGSF